MSEQDPKVEPGSQRSDTAKAQQERREAEAAAREADKEARKAEQNTANQQGQ